MGRTNEIFALTPAPLQLQFMGFPGSLGAAYVPFLVTDAIISPPEMSESYSEKLVLLNCYYLNDYSRRFAAKPPLLSTHRDVIMVRRKYGLVQNGAAFVNLNNLYKVAPDYFDLWTQVR